MRAFVYDSWGGASRLRLQDVPGTAPGRGQIRVRMAAVSINPADWKFMSGKYRLICSGPFPRRAGMEGAGTVMEVGPGVPHLAPGARVVVNPNPADGRQGTWAEEITVDAKRAYPIPEGVSMQDAATLPVAALTAQWMCAMAGVGPGKRVLISGVSGGVGSFALQIAKGLGAHVTATASGRNRDLALAMGADAFIDYRTTPADQITGSWDAVLDCVNSLRAESLRLLAPHGCYVDTDPMPHRLLGDKLRNVFSSRKRKTVMVSIDPAGMEALFKLVAAGQIRPLVGSTFPFSELPSAVAASLAGRSVGKNIVTL